MSRLLPPTDDHPASMLRWVRRVEMLMIPLGVGLALLLRAGDLGAWWLGLVVSATAIIGLATIGPAIRRAEAHGPNDPGTRAERERRAKRLTIATFSALTAIAVVVSLAAGEPLLAIVFAVLLPVSLALGLRLAPRRLDRG
jgi:phosphatidylglycerophosphate synthase